MQMNASAQRFLKSFFWCAEAVRHFLCDNDVCNFCCHKGDDDIFRRVAQILQVSGTLHDAPDAGKRTPARTSDDWRQARLAQAAQNTANPSNVRAMICRVK